MGDSSGLFLALFQSGERCICSLLRSFGRRDFWMPLFPTALSPEQRKGRLEERNPKSDLKYQFSGRLFPLFPSFPPPSPPPRSSVAPGCCEHPPPAALPGHGEPRDWHPRCPSSPRFSQAEAGEEATLPQDVQVERAATPLVPAPRGTGLPAPPKLALSPRGSHASLAYGRAQDAGCWEHPMRHPQLPLELP